ncbi:MAG: radical SAM protein [Bacteroidales bacterium]|nr:radical SAM protein [Bacteroidales bacterium]
MRYLTIQGERKKIPPFPHHKNYVYRIYRFFEVKNLILFITVNGWFRIFKEFYLNWKHRCALPRDLLIDPTSACNLKCKGCWAADYRKNSDLSYEKLDSILTEARKLGVMDILMSGGEPLMRKKDIIRLCEKHRKLTFGLFTNGTLIDETFADEMVRLGNLNVFISIEGFREETDFRRGDGVYDKVIDAMDILRKKDIGFGFSACYHSKNYEIIASDEFLDFMREKGAWFGWLFNYFPIGSDADISLCCNAEQRSYVLKKIDLYSKKNKYTLIDFANSGHKAIGCVAAGNDFAHINANGDLEPCAFCHYSDSNIHDMSLTEALKSPFFKRFRSMKPFSRNFLRPCPMMDVPDALVEVCNNSEAKSTHLQYPEPAENLALKTRPLAKNWEKAADELYLDMPRAEKRRFGILTWLLLSGNDLKKN